MAKSTISKGQIERIQSAVSLHHLAAERYFSVKVGKRFFQASVNHAAFAAAVDAIKVTALQLNHNELS